MHSDLYQELLCILLQATLYFQPAQNLAVRIAGTPQQPSLSISHKHPKIANSSPSSKSQFSVIFHCLRLAVRIAGAPQQPGEGPLWQVSRLWPLHRQPGALRLQDVLLLLGRAHLLCHGGRGGAHGGPVGAPERQSDRSEAQIRAREVSLIFYAHQTNFTVSHKHRGVS